MPKKLQQTYRCLDRSMKGRPPEYKANTTIGTKFSVEILDTLRSVEETTVHVPNFQSFVDWK